MPHCEFPAERLQFLTVFGFQIMGENDELIYAIDSHGREHLIEKTRPKIWFDDEDMGEAIQLGLLNVIITRPD